MAEDEIRERLRERELLERRIIRKIVRRKWTDHEYLEETMRLINMLRAALFDPPSKIAGECALCGQPILQRPWVREGDKNYHPWCYEYKKMVESEGK